MIPRQERFLPRPQVNDCCSAQHSQTAHVVISMQDLAQTAHHGKEYWTESIGSCKSHGFMLLETWYTWGPHNQLPLLSAESKKDNMDASSLKALELTRLCYCEAKGWV